MKKQIIDCFTFFNELDMLEFRLTELDPYVDKFVIIESTKTFTGKPKPLYYNKIKLSNTNNYIEKTQEAKKDIIVRFCF
jgi:hypothetical protein